MKIFISSYAAASPRVPWDREAEAALFDGLHGLDLAGLELPYYGRLHAHDDAWLISQLRPQWRFMLNLLPGTMDKLKENPRFGLASTDDAGRRRAVDFAEQARISVERLHATLGRKAVATVLIHSAPRPADDARPSPEAFARSLSDLRTLDWQGAELLIEHCDAALPERAPDKGFMSLKDECAAIKSSAGPASTRVLINWGRSAVETRSAAGPIGHLRHAREAGLLAGLFFSGTTPEHPHYGTWRDSHAPFSTSCPASILTPDAAKAALTEAGPLSYLGLKIQPLPISLGIPERLAMIRAGLDVISEI